MISSLVLRGLAFGTQTLVWVGAGICPTEGNELNDFRRALVVALS